MLTGGAIVCETTLLVFSSEWQGHVGRSQICRTTHELRQHVGDGVEAVLPCLVPSGTIMVCQQVVLGKVHQQDLFKKFIFKASNSRCQHLVQSFYKSGSLLRVEASCLALVLWGNLPTVLKRWSSSMNEMKPKDEAKIC